MTSAVIGHWSKDDIATNHFNFSSHSNALMYASKQSMSCSHQHTSIEELLHLLLKLLSFPGQTIIEFFPQYACGKCQLHSTTISVNSSLKRAHELCEHL